MVNLFGYNLVFYEIDELHDFDMILGVNGLRTIKGEINLFDFSLKYLKHQENPKNQNQINYTISENKYKTEIDKLMLRNERISDTLPFTTTIQATIRTTNEDPIYTKQYPYPMSDNDFVNSEIKKLLENGIIQPSRSPYNSPVWTVPKKGTDEKGKPKRRLVIDFQKLNSQTITDKYPIPDVNMTIQNLGKAKIFSTIDLESGFHQVLIKENDREKTGFSINGAKYEFIRMPFGLKNAPSIFQRCVDDILRDFIGKFAYVYIDDVLVFSSTPEEHLEHIRTIIDALHNANMKISREKSHFFKESVEYLGHIIKHNRITVDPIKVETIKNYPIPATLKDLRSFLGMASYYRKFIKNFAQIAKPLTIFLRGENGMVSKNLSAKVKLNLDQPAIEAMNVLKNNLMEQVELFQPDFNKPFELTTDASNIAIGAVLSQNKKPINFISRTLNETEQNYSTNEKELLAIVWALQKLRNYLYGIVDLTIYTDHQSLIFSISDKNPNAKIKRWKNLIEEFGAKLVYKPGHQNVVADALSRQQINNTSDNSDHSCLSSPIEILKQTTKPLNAFKTQIILQQSDNNNIETTNIFNKSRHIVTYKTDNDIFLLLSQILNPGHMNVIQVDLTTLSRIEHNLKNKFSNFKLMTTQILLPDVTEKDEQIKIVTEIHNRAHRQAKNNAQEISAEYYWPDIQKDCKVFANKCEICLLTKYERHPIKHTLHETPIPTQAGESISIDIFHMSNKLFISTIDRFSKYCYIRQIENKLNASEKLEEILSFVYPFCKNIISDNESIFISNIAKSLYNRLNIRHFATPVAHSTTNAQVERIHSTLIELSNALGKQNKASPIDELINAVKQYNNTIHSVTKRKPVDIFFNRNDKSNIQELLRTNQEQLLRFHNKNRITKEYSQGDKIFLKTDRRTKDKQKYNAHIVQEDRGDTLLTTKGKIIHKDNIRQRFLPNNNNNNNNITN